MSTHPQKQTEQPSILVADDDPGILDALKMMLEVNDYAVTTVEDGAVIPQVKKKCPNLLLLDIKMSGADGREICREIKTSQKMKHIPVILFSASQDIEKSTKQFGANDFIAKPFDMFELLGKIEKHLSN